MLLLLGGCGLLIVLVVGEVVLVPAVCGVRVSGTVVLGILGAVVRGAGRAIGLAGRAGRGTRGLLVAVVVAAVSTTTMIAITAVTATTVAALRRVVLEVLMLLLHVGEQVLAQCFGGLDLIWIGTTFQPVSQSYSGQEGR